MYLYRNLNTGNEIELKRPRRKLDESPVWDRIGDDGNVVAPGPPEADPTPQPDGEPVEPEIVDATATESETAPEPVVIDATPAAAELAQAKGLDLHSVTGTGEHGRVTIEDVRKAVEGHGSAA